MKLIKIQSSHMDVIFTPKYTTWQRKKCVLTHSLIMRYHNGNGYCDVVPNVLELIFLTRKHMISIPTPVLQFVFKFIILLHVVQNMAGFRYRQENLSRVSTGYCFSKTKKNIHYKIASDDRDNRFQFSCKFFIPAIQKLEFHIPHVQIMCTNPCVDSCRTAFKLGESFQDVLCCHDYAERVQ